jgi:hypothetical protein
LYKTDIITSILILLASILLDQYLDIIISNNLLLYLRELRQMGRNIPRVYIILCRHKKKGFILPVPKRAIVIDTTPQTYLKPSLLIIGALLYTNLVKLGIKLLDIALFICRQESSIWLWVYKRRLQT